MMSASTSTSTLIAVFDEEMLRQWEEKRLKEALQLVERCPHGVETSAMIQGAMEWIAEIMIVVSASSGDVHPEGRAGQVLAQAPHYVMPDVGARPIQARPVEHAEVVAPVALHDLGRAVDAHVRPSTPQTGLLNVALVGGLVRP